MAEPPSLQELSNEIGLSLKKLKEGFKQIYGDTVYGFLLDYKMEHARRLLESNKHNVNEVGSKIGYSTSSHFIAAFKKKFGTTPKKYVSSLSKLIYETITSYRNRKQTTNFPITIVCDAIRTPENIGMCFRISESFGVQKIYLHETSPTIENRIVQKTARNTLNQIRT